jgi:hypothetical protein
MKQRNLEGLREHPKGDAPLQDNHMESILQRLYPDVTDWKHNGLLKDGAGQKVTVAGHGFRPDYYSPSLKMVIEIDGDSATKAGHYSSAAYCVTDQLKDEAYHRLGLKVVRIPMYVQLSPVMVKHYFGLDYAEELYPAARMHGFAHPQVCVPADFCSLGLERFRREMSELPAEVVTVIRQSLDQRVQDLVDKGYTREDAMLQILPVKFLQENC